MLNLTWRLITSFLSFFFSQSTNFPYHLMPLDGIGLILVVCPWSFGFATVSGGNSIWWRRYDWTFSTVRFLFWNYFLNLDPESQTLKMISFQPHLLPQRDNQYPDPRRYQSEMKGDSTDNFCSVPVLLIAAAVPWMLPWNKISVPWLPSIHVVACMAPWVSQDCFIDLVNPCHQSFIASSRSIFSRSGWL